MNRASVLAFFGILLTIFLSALDQTIVGTAMPRIVEELQGFSLFSWVTTAYLLTSTATMPVAGKLGDMFGRKWLMLSALVIFLLGSILCGAAPTMLWLVIFRSLQGVGSGILFATSFAVTGDLFVDSAKRAKWQGFIAAAFGLASILGPSLGGFITDNLSWRWVFYVNLPVGLLALLILAFTLPTKVGTGRRKIDWWGSVTITGAVVCLLLALTWGGQKEPQGYPWLSAPILALFAGTIFLTGLFVMAERQAAEPILPLHLLSIPAIRSVSIISLSMGAILLGTSLYIPLFVQVVLGQSGAASGAIMTPMSLVVIVTNIVTGQFLGRIGILKVPYVAGTIFLMIGFGLLLTLNAASATWEVSLFMVVIGLGMGMIMPARIISVQESVERKDLGVGTSMVQFFLSIGSTVGVALVGTAVMNSYASQLNSLAGVKTLPTQLQAVIQEPQNLINTKITADLPAGIVEAVQGALAGAIHNGFFITLLTGVVLVIGILMLPNIVVKNSRGRQSRPGTTLQLDLNQAVDKARLPEGLVSTVYRKG